MTPDSIGIFVVVHMALNIGGRGHSQLVFFFIRIDSKCFIPFMRPDSNGFFIMVYMALGIGAHGHSHSGFLLSALVICVQFPIHGSGSEWDFGCGPGGVANRCSRSFSVGLLVVRSGCACSIYVS